MSELPAGWVECRLDEVAEVAYGKGLPKDRRAPDGAYEYVGSGGPIDKTPERLTHQETVVVGRKGTAGSIQRFIDGCWPSDTTFFLTVPRGIFGVLVEHQLRQANLGKQERSTALPGLGREALEAARIRLAPLAEQERIVAAIEEAFSKLDAGEANLRSAQQRLKRLRDSVLNAAVPGPGSTLPDEWLWQDLSQLSVKSGYGTSLKCSYESTGTGVIRIPNVSGGKISLDDLKFAPASETIPEDLLLNDADILIVRTNGSRSLIGRATSAHGATGLAFASYLIRFRLDLDRALPKFVALVLSAPRWRSLLEAEASSSAGQFNLSLKKLDPIPIPLPPVEEQRRIVAEVERQMSFIEAAERAVADGLQRSATLRRSVLKAAFEGRLVPQDPNDEHASVLLERIKAERAAAPKPARKRKTATT